MVDPSRDAPPQGEPPTEGELIEAARDGDASAFDRLLVPYRAPLYRLALHRLADAEAAEDVVQETFLCVYRYLASYDSRLSFRTWLWTIHLRQCGRWAKSRSKGHGVASADPLTLISADDREDRPDMICERRDQSALLREALERLPAKQADALRLRFFAGLTFPEIARSLGCSELTAKNRVRAGLTALTGSLGDPSAPVSLSQRNDESDR
ncbi:MAG TPA: RNA polymerase sigma factor [Pirellulaceae bacterium]|jgi:RNA polymerase sigma-70 factor (ECF subfamily)|nr:RNA polymerase sigma factor [Pirellulaceae bacterium]